MAASLIVRRILFNKNNICKIPRRRSGYVVLLPEIGEDLPEKNPLLKEDTKMPEFNKFTIERCIAAIGRQAIEMEQGLTNLEIEIQDMEDEEIFDKLIDPLEHLSVPLEITWGIVQALYFGSQTLMPTKLFTKLKERAERGRLVKYTNTAVYNACKKAYENKNIKLTAEQYQVLHRFVLEGKLNGLDDIKNKREFEFHETLLRREQTLFMSKFQLATKAFKRKISEPHIMRDFPDNLLASLAVDPSQPQQGPWIVRYDPFIVPKFLEYCPDSFLRFKVWEESVSLCSHHGDKWMQTSMNLESIRINRNRYAKLLGYNDYVEMNMETKMAENVDNVLKVFQTLHETAKPCQEEEINILTQFARDRSLQDDSTVNEWDIPYWSRKLLRANYEYDEEALREYFPYSKVLSGLFRICEELFNIKIVEEKQVDGWHKFVQFFNVFDLNESSEQPISSFFIDPYSRSEHKQMMPGSVVAIKFKSTICEDNPVRALIFNFPAPTAEKESLLTFMDVSDLFQKFGYALRGLLTKTNYYLTSEPLEFDAFGITSYFLENRLYETSSIKMVSQHYKTGEPLSDDIIDNLTKIRSNMAGYKLCKEMYLSELDLRIHQNPKIFWRTIYADLWKKYFVLPLHDSNEHVCSFTDIFIGSWGASFYSNLWSKMSAADAYSAFHEVPDGDEKQVKEIGKRFRETFLAYGGSIPTNEIFRKFRGRDPSPLAILKSLNLNKPQRELPNTNAKAILI